MNRIARCASAALAFAVPALAMCATGAYAAESIPLLAQAQPPPPPTPQQRVAMLKQWLQASHAQLRAYEWIETTVVTKGGEEKARKQNTCYYGVDGKLQEVPVAGATEEKPGGGPLRKKIGAKKQNEMQAYMEQAAALVRQYVPPDPSLIQQAVNSGNFSVSPAGQRARLTFRNYLKPNDALNVDLELPTNRLLGLSIASYLDDQKDAIEVDVTMGVLPDGTIFTQRSVLGAKAKDVTVTIENTGHRRHAG